MSTLNPQLQMMSYLRMMHVTHNPPDPAAVAAVTRAVNIIKTDHRQSNGQVTLQKRILEGMRIHAKAGYNPAVQKEFAAIGGFKVLIDLLVDDWPDNSDFAASSSPAGGGDRPQGGTIEAIWRDGRIFRPDWFPQKLIECMRRYKYGWTALQQQSRPDQAQDMAERLLYLAGNCCINNDNIRAMLSCYCSVPIVRTFRDNWQRKHEPVAGEPDPDRAETERAQRQQQQPRWSSMPADPDDMFEMFHDTNAELQACDMMNYSFARYLCQSIAAATNEQKQDLVDAGTIAKVRVVDAHSVPAQRSGMDLDSLLKTLLPVYERQVLVKSQKDAEARAAVVVRAEEFRLKGNALFKEGRLSEALQEWSKGVNLHPSNTLLYNNLSLVYFKMGRFNEAFDAAISGISRDPSNAKAWVRLGEAYRACGRWQLAQLAYSAALDVLKMKDAAVEEWRRQACSNLARVWQFDEVPRYRAMPWLQLPARARSSSQRDREAWRTTVSQGMTRMGNSSRRLALQLKTGLVLLQTWQQAESGKLKSLAEGPAMMRISWTQLATRGPYTKRARYRLQAYIDTVKTVSELVVDGLPSSRDVLGFVALVCLNPVGQEPGKPKLLVLDYR
eukprot:gene6906-7122_t